MLPPVSTKERLWRLRGVLAAALATVALLLAAIAGLRGHLAPRAGVEVAHTLAELRHARYAVVFDAGSTGSRVHVFKFTAKAPGGGLRLLSDTFEQLKPGLSAHADVLPAVAAASLQPLIQVALDTVPPELQSTTPVSLKATAGLRLLPGDKADRILGAVQSALRATPFRLGHSAVEVMSGQQEGAFAWLTLNYLLGTLGGSVEDTVAAIDLGGGSVQEAFAVSLEDAASAPEGYVMSLGAADRRYSVYVHSYLGHGLMAGRAKLIAHGCDGACTKCFPTGWASSYEYGGAIQKISGGDGGSFDSCKEQGLASLKPGADCGVADTAVCSFAGGWRGVAPRGRRVYASSYFWDRAMDSGIVAESGAAAWPATPRAFAEAATGACAPRATAAELRDAFLRVDESTLPYLCADLTLCHALLTHGFGLADDAPLTLVKQVEYEGQRIEAAWPLGAALNDLAATAAA